MIRKQLSLEEGFEFETGRYLPHVDIVYHVSAPERRKGQKVIWICHALTANSDVEDWWPDFAGPGKLIDFDKFYVVCVNMLGSPYGSSGPASINPETGRPYYFEFPDITIRDQARMMIQVCRHLGIETIDYMVASSVGGYQGAEWAVLAPDMIKHVFFIATAVKVSPWLVAQIEAQKMALEADQTFRQCKSIEGGMMGLRASRAQALITYRSYDGFRIAQSEPDENVLFADRAGSYERYQGKKLTDRNFDAYSYYYLLHSMKSNNVGRDRGGVRNALGRIKASATVIAIDDDGIFVPKEMKEWAAYIPHATYHEIHSQFGHDGFLLEVDQLAEIIRPLLVP